jgi:hypothetical protein
VAVAKPLANKNLSLILAILSKKPIQSVAEIQPFAQGGSEKNQNF